MNKEMVISEPSSMKMRWKKLRLKEIALISILSVLLLGGAWLVFGKDEEKVSATSTDTEKRLAAILEDMDGVGEVEVMLSDTEDGERGVVIVCQGAKDISVLLSVREAAATALGIQQKNVKIYLKKD